MIKYPSLSLNGSYSLLQSRNLLSTCFDLLLKFPPNMLISSGNLKNQAYEIMLCTSTSLLLHEGWSWWTKGIIAADYGIVLAYLVMMCPPLSKIYYLLLWISISCFEIIKEEKGPLETCESDQIIVYQVQKAKKQTKKLRSKLKSSSNPSTLLKTTGTSCCNLLPKINEKENPTSVFTREWLQLNHLKSGNIEQVLQFGVLYSHRIHPFTWRWHCQSLSASWNKYHECWGGKGAGKPGPQKSHRHWQSSKSDTQNLCFRTV